VYGHKFLRRCPWRFHALSKSEQPILMQPLGRAFEGVWTLRSVLQITMKTSRRQSNTVRTLGQSLFNTKLDFRIWHWLGCLCKPSGRHGNMSGRCPAFQNILVFRSNATRSYSEDCPDPQSSHPDVDLIKIELHCFWKDIAENRLDVANFRPDARQTESFFSRFRVSLSL
jgi:hypothetical protein